MEPQVAEVIAAKLKAAMSEIGGAIEYIRGNVELADSAPLFKAIGEICDLVTTEIYSRLAQANPDLHEQLFRGFPRDAPDKFLRMSRYKGRNQPDPLGNADTA